MKELEGRSRTKLKVQKEGDMASCVKERYVDITGKENDCKAAIELLLELTSFCREDNGKVLKDSRPPPAEEGEAPAAPMVIEVLKDEVGKLLGRKGETVKHVEKESGAKLELDKASGRLQIQGRMPAQEKALELILQEVSYAKQVDDGSILKDDGKSRRTGEEDVDGTPPMRLYVKDKEAGRVIGRGGETVREVMEKTGSDVKVQKIEEMKEAGAVHREVKIYGSTEAREKALELILAEVTWAKGEDDKLLKGVEEPVESAEPQTGEAEPGDARPAGAAADAGVSPDDAGTADEKKQATPEPPEEGQKQSADGVPAKRGARSPSSEPRRSRSERKRSGGASASKGGRIGRSGLWVCATCGGDHRTKECPHAVGVGMRMGIQMGMQAMGMQMGGIPGMPMAMGRSPMMPPMMPGPYGMGLPPGMMPPHPMFGGRPRSSSRSSDYSSCDGGSASSADGGAAASGGGRRGQRGASRGGDDDAGNAGSPEPRGRRRRRHASDQGGDGQRRVKVRRRADPDAPRPTSRRKKVGGGARVDVSDL